MCNYVIGAKNINKLGPIQIYVVLWHGKWQILTVESVQIKEMAKWQNAVQINVTNSKSFHAIKMGCYCHLHKNGMPFDIK